MTVESGPFPAQPGSHSGDENLSFTRRSRAFFTALAVLAACDVEYECSSGAAADAEPGRTTLSNPSKRFTVPEKPYVFLRRGDIEAVDVDNRAVDDDVLPGHRAG